MKYRFDYTDLKYVRVREPRRIRWYKAVRAVLLFFMLICAFNLVIALNYYTPQVSYLERERDRQLVRYETLNRRMGAVRREIDELSSRDNNTYRQILALDSAYIEGAFTPYPDSYYSAVSTLPYNALIVGAWQTIDDIARRLYLRSVSLDTLQTLALTKDQMANSVPAIWPTVSHKINSLYGMRYHPKYFRYTMHEGIDIDGNVGDPIYATANGYVKSAKIGGRYTGYGTEVLIDHGFGYQTRYAHLSKLETEAGVWVKRGELIGKLGSTGGSTGPHLHYEVIYMGATTNPLNFLRNDISAEEFEDIIRQANENPEDIDEPDIQ